MRFSVHGLRAAFAAAGCALLLAVAPVGAAGATHQSMEMIGQTFTCDNGAVYTIVSGTANFVLHEGSTPSGNWNVTGTITVSHLVAVDQYGNTVQIVGADWFGGAGNATQAVFTETDKFQILGATGGPVGTVNETSHMNTRNGTFFDFNLGGCSTPQN